MLSGGQRHLTKNKIRIIIKATKKTASIRDT